MAHQFLKKKFSFTRLFLRFFGILIFSLSLTVNVYAADSTDTKIKSLHDFYNHIVSLPFKVPNQNQNINSESKNISAQTNVLTQLSAIAGQANNLSDVIFKSFADYYDSYTSGLSSILYPVKNISLTKVTPAPSKITQGTVTASPQIEPKALSVKTTPLNSTSPRPSPYQVEGGKQIVYVPIPGPQGPKGDKGEPGTSITNFQSSSINPVAYMPVGITIPNPSQNFTGGEYASIANLTSNLFTNNTSNIITLNVSGNQTVTGNSSVGGTFNVIGSTTLTTLTAGSATLSGNLNVTGTITGSVTGAMNPALTNGSVFFQDTAGISQDNANFFYDKTNHRLGLGTVIPATQLDVSGGIRALSRLSSQSVPATGTGVELGYYSDLDLGQLLSYDRTGGVPKPFQFSGSTFTVKTSTSTPVAALLVDSSGNTTLGLTTATSGLASNLLVAKAGTTNLAIRDTTDGVELMNYVYSGGGIIGTFTNHPLYIRANNSTAMSVLANGNVGIGTTAPTKPLNLYGNLAEFQIARSANTGDALTQYNPFGAYSASNILWETGLIPSDGGYNIRTWNGAANSTPFYISTGGNIGIGTTNPGAKLHVAADVNAAYPASIIRGYFNNTAGPALSLINDNAAAANRPMLQVFSGGSTKQFEVGSDGSGYFNGNVGIGTTAPGAKLDVMDGTSHIIMGNNAFGGNWGVITTDPALNGTNYALASNIASGTYINAPSTKEIGFKIANGQVATINSSGNLGIGTTAPGAKLQIDTASANNGFYLKTTDVATTNATHKSSPAWKMIGSIWDGAAAQSWGAGLQIVGVSGINGAYNVRLSSDYYASLLDIRGDTAQATFAGSVVINGVNGISGGGTAGNTSFAITALPTSNKNITINPDTTGATYLNYSGGTGGIYFGDGATGTTGRIQSNGNVGIGTTAPGAKLEVAGSASNDFRISRSAFPGTYTYINAPGGSFSNAQFGVSGTLAFSMQSNSSVGIGVNYANGISAFPTSGLVVEGNVGIGTTTPASKLHIHGTVPYGQARFTPTSAAGESSIGFFDDVAGTDANDAWSVGQGSWGQTGKFVIGNENNGAGGNVRLLIQKDGNVGIGTTGPGYALDIARSGADVSTNYAAMEIKTTGTTGYGPALILNAGSITNGHNWQIVSSGGSDGVGLATGKLGFFDKTAYDLGQTTTAVRMIIDSTGNVGIGTTAPANALDIGSTQGIHITSGTPTSTTAALYNNAGVLTWNGSAVSAGAPAFSAITGGTNTAAAMVVGTGSSLTYQGGAATSGSINANLYKGNSLVAVADGGTGTSSGSITGTGALTYTAGGTNQNVTLTPSGTGYTLLNGNVGIGTTTPAALLTLEGSGAINGGLNAGLNIRSTNASGLSLFRFTTSDNVSFDFGKNGPSNQGGSVYFWASTNIPIAFGNNNVARLSMDTTGGISMGSYAAAGGGGSPANGLVVSGNVGIGVSGPGAKLSVSGGVGIGSSYSGTAVSDGNMIIQSNLGIGTVTPSSKLSLGNNIATGFLDNYNEYQILLYDSATPSSSVGIGVKSNTMVFNSGSGAYSFDRGGSVTAMAIDLAGNVGIGTTAPGAPLEVKGTGTGATIAKFTDVNTTGCAIATGGTIACSSDVRLKKNIENINYGLSTVMQLRPVLYNWNYETDGQTKSLGFIAQEVEALIPKLVATDDQGMKSLNTTGIIPILTKGIQELDLKITDLSDLNNLTKANTLRDNLVAWFSNVENKITRIFTGEVCLTEPGQDPVCLNRTELQSLKSLLQNQGALLAPQNPPVPEPTPEPTPVCTDPQILVNNVCVDPTPTPVPEPEVIPAS